MKSREGALILYYVIRTNTTYLCELHGIQWWGTTRKHAKRYYPSGHFRKDSDILAARGLVSAMRDNGPYYWANGANLRITRVVLKKKLKRDPRDKRTCACRKYEFCQSCERTDLPWERRFRTKVPRGT